VLLCAVTIGLVARNAGGWWPTTWGWGALGLLFVAAAALLLRPRIELGPLDLAFLGGLGALTTWTAVSWLWSESPPSTALEIERTLVYLAAALALLVVAHRRSLAAALGGILAVIVVLSCYALATRLAADVIQQRGSSLGFRLAGVFLYPNGLGIVAVMGLLIALGFVADGAHPVTRAVAGAATVPLAMTLWLSNSRGALLALVIGLAAVTLLTPRRRHLVVVVAPLAALGLLAIWLASRSTLLTHWADPSAAVGDGHRMALALFALSAGACAISIGWSRGVAVGVVAAVALAVVVAPVSPARGVLAAGAGASLVPGSPAPGTTPAGRLFSATSNSRTEYWRVALHDFLGHPLLGSGAGTFVREWYRHRHVKIDVQDAHSLYLEMLAELGVVGLGLVLVVLAIPTLAALQVRRRRYVVGGFGAFVAFAAHAAVDWDWELPGITLAGLLCGGLLVVAARTEAQVVVLDRNRRLALLAPVLSLLALAFIALVGNRANAAALAAVSRGDWRTAASEARRAARWEPWSAEALELEADAAIAKNDLATARTLLRRAVRKDGSDFELWGRLASVTRGSERKAALEREAQLNPLG